MSSLDGTIVATALPTLHRTLHAKVNWVSWTVTAYQLGLAVTMPFAGRLSDLLGRKKVFVRAAILFVVSSFLCGLSVSIWVLIPLRFLQAMGGGAFLPSATGIVSETFESDRDRMLGLFSTIFPLGALVGPVVGGLLIADVSWRAVFWVNVPVGTGFLVLALRLLPPDTHRAEGRLPDLWSAACLCGVFLGLMTAISHLGDAGASAKSGAFIAAVLVAICSGWLLARRSRTAAVPVIPLRLLSDVRLAVMNCVNLVWGATVIGIGALIPLFAETEYRLAPVSSGTLLTARAVVEVVTSVAASNLLKRTGYRAPMIVGFGLIVGGTGMLVSPVEMGSPYVWLAIAAGVIGAGIGISAPSANNATLSFAPRDVGAISGLRGMSRQAGAIFGVSAATAFVARSGHEGHALAESFVAIALLLVTVTPLVFLVPARPAAPVRRGGAAPSG
jgi:EmrB/QacA subfamily drug resistance transporter